MPRLVIAALLSTLASASALALELPAHRPGLWELKLKMGNAANSALALQSCMDARSNTLLAALASGWAEDACAKPEMRRENERLVIESHCNVGGANLASHAEITGDFDRAYTLRVTTRPPQGAAASAGAHHLTADARWLGECPAGHKPGDIILPGGITMNVRNIKGILGLLAPRQ